MRSRDQNQNADMLRSALAVMQEKNSTLEKNLSAETRVKLDLFSALGEARRQLEIKDGKKPSRRTIYFLIRSRSHITWILRGGVALGSSGIF